MENKINSEENSIVDIDIKNLNLPNLKHAVSHDLVDYSNLYEKIKKEGNYYDTNEFKDLENNIKIHFNEKIKIMEDSLSSKLDTLTTLIKDRKESANNPSQVVQQRIAKQDKSLEYSKVLEENKDNLSSSVLNQTYQESKILCIDGSDYINIESSHRKAHIANKIDSTDEFVEDLCGICSSEIFKYKYDCLICENLVLCDSCEKYHNHPVIKYKDLSISTKEDAYMLLSKSKYLLNNANNYYNTGILDKTYKIRMKTISNLFSIRPNTIINMYITIVNDCRNIISEGLQIIPKNHKDLNIKSYIIRDPIEQKESKECKIQIISKDVIKLYDIEFILYHKKYKIDHNELRVKIDVNNDMDEELINTKLHDYPKILPIPKEIKLKIFKIIEDGLSTENPYIIYYYLQKANYNIEIAVNMLLNIARK